MKDERWPKRIFTSDLLYLPNGPREESKKRKVDREKDGKRKFIGLWKQGTYGYWKDKDKWRKGCQERPIKL